MRRTFLILLVIFFIPGIALADDQNPGRSRWSLEIKGGLFNPALDNWRAFYGDRAANEYGGSLAYKLFRQLEAGLEGGYVRAAGQGFAPAHNYNAGHVVYELYPLSAFVLFRGVLKEDQWLVPYVGGGWTRMYYSEKIDYQDTVTGFADGYHVRGGVQLLLDGMDPDAATSMLLDYGIYHTYLFVEAERTSAKIDTVSSGSVDLGGTSFFAGLLFEF